MPLKTVLAAQHVATSGNNRQLWRLTAALVYKDEQYEITVPSGFETDYSSVPRLPVVYLLAGDTAHEAAVIHDYLYHINGVSRKQADDLFYKIARETGEPLWRAWAMWSGIRAGGWVQWNKYRALDEHERTLDTHGS